MSNWSCLHLAQHCLVVSNHRWTVLNAGVNTEMVCPIYDHILLVVCVCVCVLDQAKGQSTQVKYILIHTQQHHIKVQKQEEEEVHKYTENAELTFYTIDLLTSFNFLPTVNRKCIAASCWLKTTTHLVFANGNGFCLFAIQSQAVT